MQGAGRGFEGQVGINVLWAPSPATLLVRGVVTSHLDDRNALLSGSSFLFSSYPDRSWLVFLNLKSDHTIS